MAPEPTDPNETLVMQATGGDSKALEALLERHLPALLGYVRLRAAAVIRDHES